jgi:hypothetical protein
MPRIRQPRADWAFYLSTATSERSKEVVILAEADDIYASGTILVAEHDAEGEATGFHVAATSVVDLSAYPSVDAAVLGIRTDAQAGNTPATVIARDAEIKGDRTDLADLSVGSRALVDAALSDAGIIVR